MISPLICIAVVFGRSTTRYAEADKKFKQRNAELTEEYRRITKQYKELQLKFRHFDLADQEKFRVRLVLVGVLVDCLCYHPRLLSNDVYVWM